MGVDNVLTSQLRIISKESCFVSAVSTENCTAK